MKKEKKVTFINKLFIKVYLNYAVILTIFAVLLGFIYIKLYETKTMDNYKEKLKTQGSSIAKNLARTIITDEINNYIEYLYIMDEIDNEAPDIYTITNPNAKSPMDIKFQNYDYASNELSEDCNKVIEAAFQNQITSQKGYYEEFGEVSLIMGIPVKVNNEVVAMVLLRSSIKNQQNIVNASMLTIIQSTVTALVFSFIIAYLFSRNLSDPIYKMSNTALKLADSQYEAKTNIDRKDEIGDLARLIDFLSDKLKNNELERQDRDQMRADFFANISHELRTPITVIRAYAESLMDGIITDEDKINQYYIRIFSECKGMERTVSDLLLLSKLDNPDFIIEKEPVNIVQIFDDLIRSIHVISEKKNITIELKKEQPSYMMMGDYDRLRQMFFIVLDNAIKFSNENTTVHVSLSKKNKLEISIRDEGIGISEEELKYIFIKFYKSKLIQNETGSGIGLTIAQKICLKLGGNIEVKSTIGIGTEFIFSFPLLENCETI